MAATEAFQKRSMYASADSTAWPRDPNDTLYLTQINFPSSTSPGDVTYTCATADDSSESVASGSSVDGLSFVSGISYPCNTTLRCTIGHSVYRKFATSSDLAFQDNLVIIRVPSGGSASTGSWSDRNEGSNIPRRYVTSVSDNGAYSQGIGFNPSRRRFFGQTDGSVEDRNSVEPESCRLSSTATTSQSRRYVSHLYIHSRGTPCQRQASRDSDSTGSQRRSGHKSGIDGECDEPGVRESQPIVTADLRAHRLSRDHSTSEDSTSYLPSQEDQFHKTAANLTEHVISESFRIVSDDHRSNASDVQTPDSTEGSGRRFSASDDDDAYEVALQPSEILNVEQIRSENNNTEEIGEETVVPKKKKVPTATLR